MAPRGISAPRNRVSPVRNRVLNLSRFKLERHTSLHGILQGIQGTRRNAIQCLPVVVNHAANDLVQTGCGLSIILKIIQQSFYQTLIKEIDQFFVHFFLNSSGSLLTGTTEPAMQPTAKSIRANQTEPRNESILLTHFLVCSVKGGI